MGIDANQRALKSFIANKLINNTQGVLFDVGLFFNENSDYFYYDEDGNKIRRVPVMMPDIIGNYLNIPNSNTLTLSAGLMVDVFVGTTDESDREEDEYRYVQYTDTMNALQELKSELLARYHPLGTPYLYMGGEDSTVDLSVGSTISVKTIYLDFIPKNTDAEDILYISSGSDIRKLYKDATDIIFQTGASSTIRVAYTANESIKLIVYNDGTNWNMQIDGDDAATPVSSTTVSFDDAIIGGLTGFEGIIKTIAIGNSNIEEFDFDNATTEIANWNIILSDWDSKDTANNTGSTTLTTDDINNSILWSTDGNAIFSVGSIVAASDMRVVDGSNYYQMYDLEINCVVSNDVVFGNNFEYYLDGIQVYPIDRSHTMSTELSGAQYLNSNYNEFIATETARDDSLSFYYIPSKKLTKLLKHTVSNTVEQNTTYTLTIQYPFFKEEYDVIIENGGTNPNINTISDFTVTFKKADSNL